MFYFDPLYILIILVTLGLSLWATGKVKIAFAKYSKIPSPNGLTGADVARQILQRHGVRDVEVDTVSRRFMVFGGDGILTDHYDPRAKVVRLSPGVYNSASIAAQAVAAHEAGHAIQHATQYAPLAVRNAMVPVAGLGSNLSYILIILGLVMNALFWVKLGIILFATVVAFQFLTIPVELDASRRAKGLLEGLGLVSPDNKSGVAAVLPRG